MLRWLPCQKTKLDCTLHLTFHDRSQYERFSGISFPYKAAGSIVDSTPLRCNDENELNGALEKIEAIIHEAHASEENAKAVDVAIDIHGTLKGKRHHHSFNSFADMKAYLSSCGSAVNSMLQDESYKEHHAPIR